MHREINENLTTTNVSRLNRTRCGVSGGPMFRVDVVRDPGIDEADLVPSAQFAERTLWNEINCEKKLSRLTD